MKLSPFGVVEEARSACWLSWRPTLEAEDWVAGGAMLVMLSRTEMLTPPDLLTPQPIRALDSLQIFTKSTQAGSSTPEGFAGPLPTPRKAVRRAPSENLLLGYYSNNAIDNAHAQCHMTTGFAHALNKVCENMDKKTAQ